MTMNRSVVLLLLIAVLAGSIWGCGMMQQKKGKEHAVEYTVLGEDQIPDEIRKVVDVKKQEEFQMTYQSEKELFLIKGYGQQMSGGYSIQVEELGVTSQAIFFKTKLIGPSDTKITLSPPSYPYIVVKTEYRKEPVIFE